MFGLPDERVRVANEAMAELIGSPLSAIVGLRPAQVWDGADGQRSQMALSALTVGAVDSYRARRRLHTSSGPVAVSVWARRMLAVGGSVVVVIVVPDTESKSATRSVGAFFGPDALDLAVGTFDRDWWIDRVTPKSGMVLGENRSELADVDLASLVHPDDVDLLVRSVRNSAANSERAFVRVRLRHATRGWAETRCLLFPLPQDETGSVVFVLAQAAADVPPGPDAERIATLERHLLRFAAELHAGGWREVQPPGADASHWVALDKLPRRQREIVDRLLRGERVPSIAASMYISASTVRNHLSNVFAGFGVHSQSELLAVLRLGSGAVQRGEPEHRD
jgi:DNA-binding CsgD family transcriptional regulator